MQSETKPLRKRGAAFENDLGKNPFCPGGREKGALLDFLVPFFLLLSPGLITFSQATFGLENKKCRRRRLLRQISISNLLLLLFLPQNRAKKEEKLFSGTQSLLPPPSTTGRRKLGKVCHIIFLLVAKKIFLLPPPLPTLASNDCRSGLGIES